MNTVMTVRMNIHFKASKNAVSNGSRDRPHTFAVVLCCLGLLLAGCSPAYNWREVHGSNAPYIVLFPDKPETLTRTLDLNGLSVTMTMMAAKVDKVAFAVGSAEVADNTAARAALPVLKDAMLANIHGSIESDTTSSANPTQESIILKAHGKSAGSGAELVLAAHFLAHNRYIYQIIVLGPKPVVTQESIDTFLLSFKTE